MGLKWYRYSDLILLIFLFPFSIPLFTRIDFWPFMTYSMFSDKDSFTQGKVKIRAITETGAIDSPFYPKNLVYPASMFHTVRALNHALIVEKDKERARQMLKALFVLNSKIENLQKIKKLEVYMNDASGESIVSYP